MALFFLKIFTNIGILYQQKCVKFRWILEYNVIICNKVGGIDLESVRNKLGPLIKQKRKLLGMTQEDLAERLNISISFAGQIERGEAMPSVEMLQLIITELDLDPRALFFDEKVEVNEYTELCLIMRRMSTQQRKLVLDFARMLRSYKLL